MAVDGAWRGVLGGDEAAKSVARERAAGLRIADHALRHALRIDARHIRQGLNHLQFRHADAQGARRQFEERQPLLLRQGARPLAQALQLLRIVEASQRKQALAHPDVQRRIFDAFGRRQQQAPMSPRDRRRSGSIPRTAIRAIASVPAPVGARAWSRSSAAACRPPENRRPRLRSHEAARRRWRRADSPAERDFYASSRSRRRDDGRAQRTPSWRICSSSGTCGSPGSSGRATSSSASSPYSAAMACASKPFSPR